MTSAAKKPTAWEAAIVAVDDETFEVDWSRTIFMSNAKSEDERKRCCEALAKVEWLASHIKQLDRRLRQNKRDDEYVRTEGMHWEINDVKARLRKKRIRPRGGVHEAAIEEVASSLSMKPGTLKKRLQRHKPRQK